MLTCPCKRSLGEKMSLKLEQLSEAITALTGRVNGLIRVPHGGPYKVDCKREGGMVDPHDGSSVWTTQYIILGEGASKEYDPSFPFVPNSQEWHFLVYRGSYSLKFSDKGKTDPRTLKSFRPDGFPLFEAAYVRPHASPEVVLQAISQVLRIPR